MCIFRPTFLILDTTTIANSFVNKLEKTAISYKMIMNSYEISAPGRNAIPSTSPTPEYMAKLMP